jgi:hypothetical protein
VEGTRSDQDLIGSLPHPTSHIHHPALYRGQPNGYVWQTKNRTTNPSSRFGNQRGAATTTGRIADS